MHVGSRRSMLRARAVAQAPVGVTPGHIRQRLVESAAACAGPVGTTPGRRARRTRQQIALREIGTRQTAGRFASPERRDCSARTEKGPYTMHKTLFLAAALVALGTAAQAIRLSAASRPASPSRSWPRTSPGAPCCRASQRLRQRQTPCRRRRKPRGANDTRHSSRHSDAGLPRDAYWLTRFQVRARARETELKSTRSALPLTRGEDLTEESAVPAGSLLRQPGSRPSRP